MRMRLADLALMVHLLALQLLVRFTLSAVLQLSHHNQSDHLHVSSEQNIHSIACLWCGA